LFNGCSKNGLLDCPLPLNPPYPFKKGGNYKIPLNPPFQRGEAVFPSLEKRGVGEIFGKVFRGNFNLT